MSYKCPPRPSALAEHTKYASTSTIVPLSIDTSNGKSDWILTLFFFLLLSLPLPGSFSFGYRPTRVPITSDAWCKVSKNKRQTVRKTRCERRSSTGNHAHTIFHVGILTLLLLFFDEYRSMSRMSNTTCDGNIRFEHLQHINNAMFLSHQYTAHSTQVSSASSVFCLSARTEYMHTLVPKRDFSLSRILFILCQCFFSRFCCTNQIPVA